MHSFTRLTLAAACLLATVGVSSLAHAQVYGTTFGGPGGSPYDLQCPGSSPFMTGVTARAGQYVDALRPQCGSQTTAWAGGTGGSEVTRFCAAGSYIKTIWVKSGGWVDNIVFQCATEAAIKGNTGAATSLYPIGGLGGGNWQTWACPSDQAAVGIYGGAGQWIDRVGLVCKVL